METYSVLPLYVDPYYGYSATIGSSTYRFNFYWNSECNFGSLTISDLNNNPIVKGIKLNAGINLLNNYSYLIPDLELYGIYVDNSKIYPDQWEIGQEFQLIYYDFSASLAYE